MLIKNNSLNILSTMVSEATNTKIGEPGTQLTMRTFHVGGTATAGAQVNKMESKTAGIVSFDNVKTVTRDDGSVIIMNKIGEIVIKTDQGDEKERYPAQYGATLFFKDGDTVNVGDKILEWDPFAMPIMSEVKGRIKFEDMIVGSTVKEEMDAVTGLSHKVVTETKVKEDASKQPQIILVDEDGNPVIVPGTKRHAIYRLPIGAHITVDENQEIDAGIVIAKVQRESTKTKDITGGLPRVAELFEARKPANSALIADIAGTIEFGPEVRGSRRVIIKPEEGEDANLSCHGDNALSSGLKAKIYALKNKYINRKSGSASIKSILMRHKLVYIEDFIADKIDVEPRNYSLGVVGREGSYIVDPRTNLELLENYVIKYEGYISVQDEPEEGRYEFALLSDDGVLLKIGRRHMISTKKDMSPTLNCSRRTIYLKKNRPVKLRLFYHQGPRNKVSNTLLWRKVEKNCHVTSSRSSCGKKLNSISSLLSEGWSVVPQHVLKHKRKECLRVKTHCKIAK